MPITSPVLSCCDSNWKQFGLVHEQERVTYYNQQHNDHKIIQQIITAPVMLCSMKIDSYNWWREGFSWLSHLLTLSGFQVCTAMKYTVLCRSVYNSSQYTNEIKYIHSSCDHNTLLSSKHTTNNTIFWKSLACSLHITGGGRGGSSVRGSWGCWWSKWLLFVRHFSYSEVFSLLFFELWW